MFRTRGWFARPLPRVVGAATLVQGMGAYLFQPSTVSLLVTTALGLQFHFSWFLGLDTWISVALIWMHIPTVKHVQMQLLKYHNAFGSPVLEKKCSCCCGTHLYAAHGRLRQCAVTAQPRRLCIESQPVSKEEKEKLKQNPGRGACLTAAYLASLSPCRERWVLRPLSTVLPSVRQSFSWRNSMGASGYEWTDNFRLWEPKTQLAFAFFFCDTDCIGFWEMGLFVLLYNVIFYFKFFTHWCPVARPGPNLEPQPRGARAVGLRQQCSGLG